MRPILCMEIMVVVMIAGCAHYGELEKDYGKSYNLAKSGMIMNPAGSQNLKPVAGLAGRPAAAVMDKYAESFAGKAAKPAPKSFVVPIMPLESGTGQNAAK